MNQAESDKQLGHYFQAFRQARHLSLTAATGGQFNSALSRFENGQTMLSNDRLYLVMANLAMSPADLRDAGLMFTNAFEHAYLRLRALRWEPDAAAVAAVVDDYRAATATRRDPLHQVDSAVLTHLCERVASRHCAVLPDEVSEAVHELLCAEGQWLVSDYQLLTLAGPYLPLARVDSIYTAWRKQTAEQLAPYRADAAYAMAALLLAQVRQGGTHKQDALIADVADLLPAAWDRDGRWGLNVLLAAVKHRLGLPGAAAVRRDIAQAVALGLPQTAGYQARLDAFLNGEGDGLL